MGTWHTFCCTLHDFSVRLFLPQLWKMTFFSVGTDIPEDYLSRVGLITGTWLDLLLDSERCRQTSLSIFGRTVRLQNIIIPYSLYVTLYRSRPCILHACELLLVIYLLIHRISTAQPKVRVTKLKQVQHLHYLKIQVRKSIVSVCSKSYNRMHGWLDMISCHYCCQL